MNIDDENVGVVNLPASSGGKIMNQVGFRIFSLIDGTGTPKTIARTNYDGFDVDCGTALIDVHAFLGESEEEGLLSHPIPDEIGSYAGIDPPEVGSATKEPSN